MDIRIYALLLLFAFVGSNAEFRSSARHRRDVERKTGEYYNLAKIIKRAADSTTTTTTKSSEDDTSSSNKNPGITSPNTASPGTASPSTTNPTTTKATPSSPKPTKPTSGTTKATTTKSEPTSTETTTKPTTEATSKPQLGSRSAFEDKDDSPSKPSNSDEKSEKKPSAVSPRIKPDTPDNKDKSPSSPPILNPSAGSSYPFPGFNSIPPYGPNYAFTSTNHSPGGSASASASSFASAGASSGNPGYPAFDSRGGFYPNTPFYNPGYIPNNMWPINDFSQNNPTKPITSSRSSFDTENKPTSSNNSPTGNDAHPVNNPNSIPSTGPQNFPTRSFGGPYTPNFDYPPVNSVQGPNYAWTNSGPGYAGASAGASTGSGPTFGSRGAFPDNNAAVGYMDNSAYSPGIIDPGFAFPQSGFGPDFSNDFAVHQRMMEDHFKAIQAQIEAQQRAIFEASNGLGSGPGSSDPGLQSAISSISVGPRGGFQAGQINPAAPGIESRFANELPPPSGGQYGVFASSHSSSATDGSGRTIAHKSATTGVNDNGKITFRTVQDK
ncbi:hypothetical protein HZH68_007679 [Vespula germanica]|uniref:Uncharacterized protein n=1 Tax=Vespula germanica TaxID=30212 RepID=A0A834K468_VESGE|nr:hypothetical protein HZH68_007679 [Vespula germanica]